MVKKRKHDIIIALERENGFISSTWLSENFNTSIDEATNILEKGVKLGILFNSSENDYGLKEILKEECLIEFDEFLNDYFGNIKSTSKFYNEELTELREEVFSSMLLKKKDMASELIVKYIESNNHIYTTRNDKASEMWIYQKGIYVPNGKTFIKEFCRFILGHIYTTHFCNEVIGKIEGDTFINQDELFKQENTFEVPIKNGILNIITKEVKPFSPKKIFFNKLPIKYDHLADCPKITQHFNNVLKDESDTNVMFELFGYLLLKKNKLEKAFMFLGNGSNGKTKTIELIKHFLGEGNYSSLPLRSLNEESFSLSELFGKMANLSGDLSSTALKETGIIKMLISTDQIQAKRKFLNDLNFENYSKLIFACNELPKIYDMSDGFWRRWVLLDFPFKFVTQKEMNNAREKDKKKMKLANFEIVNEITTDEEMSGLLNKALEGLQRILKEREFSYSKGTNEVKEMWIRLSDSFTAFCLDHLEDDPEKRISKKELRKLYHKYRKNYKLKPSSDLSIKITLQNMFGVSEIRDSEGDWYWEGIKCKECMGFSTYRKKINFPMSGKTHDTLAFCKNVPKLCLTNEEIEKAGYTKEELDRLLKKESPPDPQRKNEN